MIANFSIVAVASYVTGNVGLTITSVHRIVEVVIGNIAARGVVVNVHIVGSPGGVVTGG